MARSGNGPKTLQLKRENLTFLRRTPGFGKKPLYPFFGGEGVGRGEGAY